MRRSLLLSGLALLLGLLLGSVATYYVQRNDAGLNTERSELATILRATDFQNRVTMIRALRGKDASPEEIAAWELSALVLLQTIDIDGTPKNSNAGYTLRKVAETLLSYRADYPINEFDPGNRPAIAKLLTTYKK